MRIHRLKLHNFFSYADAELDLSRVSLCSVVGPNGSGKSSLIIEAVMWAIFGHAKLANKDLVRSGATDAKVELSFELDGHRYEITRSFGKVMEVKLRVDGKPIAQGKKNQTDELLARLRIDRELLLHSVVVSQGQLSSFVSAAPAERRELIRGMLNLGRFDQAYETARNAHQTLQTAIKTHDQHVGSIKTQLQRYPEPKAMKLQIQVTQTQVDEGAAEIEGLVTRRESLVVQDRTAREKVLSLEGSLGKLQVQQREDTARFTRMIQEAEGSLVRIDQEVAMLPEHQKAVQALEEEVALAEEIERKAQEIKTARESADRVAKQQQEELTMAMKGEGRCPLCGNEMGTERWDRWIANMKEQLEGTLRLRSELTAPKQGRAKVKIREDLDNIKRRIAQVELRQGQRQEFVNALATVRADRDKTLPALEAHIQQLTGELVQAQGQLNAEVTVLDMQIKDARGRHQQTVKILERQHGELAGQEALFRSLEDAEGQLVNNQARLPEYAFVSEALAPTGIQLMIINHYLPLIEGRSQDLLSRMSDGQLSMQLKTVESRGVELLAGSDQLRPVRALSGGEQTRVSLAVRLALSQVLAEMVGTKFDIILVDEPEFLDPAGVDQFIQAIHRMSEQFPQIFVVSHHAELQRAFPSTIMVSKVNGVSQVEVQV